MRAMRDERNGGQEAERREKKRGIFFLLKWREKIKVENKIYYLVFTTELQ